MHLRQTFRSTACSCLRSRPSLFRYLPVRRERKPKMLTREIYRLTCPCGRNTSPRQGMLRSARRSPVRSAGWSFRLSGDRRLELLAICTLSPAAGTPDTVTAESGKLNTARARYLSNHRDKVVPMRTLIHQRDYTSGALSAAFYPRPSPLELMSSVAQGGNPEGMRLSRDSIVRPNVSRANRAITWLVAAAK